MSAEIDRDYDPTKETIPITVGNKVFIHTIDNTTGEILQTEELSLKAYEKRKYVSKFNPYTCKTEDQLRDYCLSVRETQHAKMWNNTNMLRESPYYMKMLKLFRHIKYRNIVFMTKKELCTQLSTTRPNEVLNRMQDNYLLKYEYIKQYKHYRLEANPAYLFKGSGRNDRITQWYRSSNSVSNLIGDELPADVVTPVVDDVEDVEWFYTDSRGHHLIYPCNNVILWCNDFDFSLVVNNEVEFEQLRDAYEDVIQQGNNTYFKSML